MWVHPDNALSSQPLVTEKIQFESSDDTINSNLESHFEFKIAAMRFKLKELEDLSEWYHQNKASLPKPTRTALCHFLKKMDVPDLIL